MRLKMEVKTITQQTIGRLLAVVQEAIDCGLSLEQADLILIGELIETVDYLQAQLASQGITIKKLQKLLGMIPSSEKGPSPCEAGKTKPNQSANSTSGNRDGEAPDEAANEAEDPAAIRCTHLIAQVSILHIEAQISAAPLAS
jgi:hypothetical protein